MCLPPPKVLNGGHLPLKFRGGRKIEKKIKKRPKEKSIIVAKLSVGSKQMGRKRWLFEGVTPINPQFLSLFPSKVSNFCHHCLHGFKSHHWHHFRPLALVKWFMTYMGSNPTTDTIWTTCFGKVFCDFIGFKSYHWHHFAPFALVKCFVTSLGSNSTTDTSLYHCFGKVIYDLHGFKSHYWHHFGPLAFVKCFVTSLGSNPTMDTSLDHLLW